MTDHTDDKGKIPRVPVSSKDNIWAGNMLRDLFTKSSSDTSKLTTSTPQLQRPWAIASISKGEQFDMDRVRLHTPSRTNFDHLMTYLTTKKIDLLGEKKGAKESGIGRSYSDELNAAANKKHTPLTENSNFASALRFVLDIEQGLSNHSKGHGGKTIFGIASASHKDVFDKVMEQYRAGKIDKALEITADFYKAEFWDKIKGIENLSPTAQKIAFDTSILHGVKFANKMIDKTNGDPDAMLYYRADKLVQIAEHNPHSKNKYFAGWMNRVEELAIELRNQGHIFKYPHAPIMASNTLHPLPTATLTL